ncbi:MAG: hypothetical protein WC322_04865 [Candidatus Paceibacterota bacterium]|jgi:hypothetical protein
MTTAKDKPKTTRGKQNRLPGVPGGIPELEECGFEYAAIRDKRQELLRKEVELKKRAKEAMHQHNRTHYKYGDLEMELEPGEETLRVRVTKPKKGAADGPAE